MTNKSKFYFIHLFASVGGFHLALAKSRSAKCLFSSEIEVNVQKT